MAIWCSVTSLRDQCLWLGHDSTLETSVGNSMVEDATPMTGVSGSMARDVALKSMSEVQ